MEHAGVVGDSYTLPADRQTDRQTFVPQHWEAVQSDVDI